MLEKVEKLEKYFRVLAGELDKQGSMNGIIVELTAKILKEIKEIKENG